MTLFEADVLARLGSLQSDVADLKALHQRMIADHRQRMHLMDELLAESRERNASLDKMIRECGEDDWWQKGEPPPWT